MEIIDFIQRVVDKQQLQVLSYLIAANFVLGIVAALARGTFELVKLMGFWKRVAVTFGSYLTVAIAAMGLTDFGPMREAIWVALIAYLAANILGNIKDLIGRDLPGQKWVERSE